MGNMIALNKYHRSKLFGKNVYNKLFILNSKYGDEAIYFDLDDMANTIGNWDLYGQDDSKRYPSLQADFFNRAGQALNRRAAMLAFCTISGSIAIVGWGLKGSKDAKLPITTGPQKTPQVGPRGRL